MTIFETILIVLVGIVCIGIILLSMYDNECKLEEEREIREMLLSLEKEEES